MQVLDKNNKELLVGDDVVIHGTVLDIHEVGSGDKKTVCVTVQTAETTANGKPSNISFEPKQVEAAT